MIQHTYDMSINNPIGVAHTYLNIVRCTYINMKKRVVIVPDQVPKRAPGREDFCGGPYIFFRSSKKRGEVMLGRILALALTWIRVGVTCSVGTRNRFGSTPSRDLQQKTRTRNTLNVTKQPKTRTMKRISTWSCFWHFIWYVRGCETLKRCNFFRLPSGRPCIHAHGTQMGVVSCVEEEFVRSPSRWERLARQKLAWDLRILKGKKAPREERGGGSRLL